jgi:hypothetical protein
VSRICIVCGKVVAETDTSEHLATNHLGPHYFWFDARRFKSSEPSMKIGEIVTLVGASPSYLVYEDRNGGRPGPSDDVGRGAGEWVDLTREPHFFAVPPATAFRGFPE